jgi:hypothetical protein
MRQINDNLKKIIFNKLYKDLSHVEIICCNNSVWFIDRNKRYWYFQLEPLGILWWRHSYFTSFFEIFSIKTKEFTPILIQWVEEVLNSKFSVKTQASSYPFTTEISNVMDCEIFSNEGRMSPYGDMVNDALSINNIFEWRVKSLKCGDVLFDGSMERILDSGNSLC